jgi:hypothetical protein
MYHVAKGSVFPHEQCLALHAEKDAPLYTLTLTLTPQVMEGAVCRPFPCSM